LARIEKHTYPSFIRIYMYSFKKCT